MIKLFNLSRRFWNAVDGSLADSIFDAPITDDGAGEGADDATNVEAIEPQADSEPGALPKTEDSKLEEPKPETKPEEPKVEDQPKPKEEEVAEKPKKDGVAELRKHKETLEGELKTERERATNAEKIVEENFGGSEGLDVAKRLFDSVTADEFDVEDAMTGLQEINPDAVSAITDYFKRNITALSREQVLKSTFGRVLEEDEVIAVTEWLATGGQDASGDELPDSLTVDSDGNPLPKAVTDMLRANQMQIKNLTTKINSVEKASDERSTEALSGKANEAVNRFITDNFSIIDNVVSEYGLDKPIEGESADQKTEREEDMESIVLLAMGYFSKDQAAVELNKQALNAVVKGLKSQGHAAKAASYSRRIQAAFDKYARKATEVIMRGRVATAAKVNRQIEEADSDKIEVGGNSGANTSGAKTKIGADPFDSEDIHNQVKELTRTGKISNQWSR